MEPGQVRLITAAAHRHAPPYDAPPCDGAPLLLLLFRIRCLAQEDDTGLRLSASLYCSVWQRNANNNLPDTFLLPLNEDLPVYCTGM